MRLAEKCMIFTESFPVHTGKIPKVPMSTASWPLANIPTRADQ